LRLQKSFPGHSIVGDNLEVSSVEREEVRAAEVIGSLSLATDLGIGVPLEHGLLSTWVAVRLADRLGVDEETAHSVFYSCLLFYVGCTAGAELAADVFGADDALTTYGTPVRSGLAWRCCKGCCGRSPRREVRCGHGPAS
jgi:hypothetical protein